MTPTAEYHVQAKDADAHWWRSQLWVLAVSQVILFAPTITEGGGFEQAGFFYVFSLLVLPCSVSNVGSRQRM